MSRDFIKGRYASLERDANGTWAVFNDVTGLLVREGLTANEARVAFEEIQNHYRAVERGIS